MIVVATPTRDDVTAGTVSDLLKLWRTQPDNLKWFAPMGCYIQNSRNYCVDYAKKNGASHLLFIDADMRFPEDTLDRLLRHNLPIVAANYVMRSAPALWVANIGGQSVSSVDQRGLQPVDHVGCGVMLIDMSVFETVGWPPFSCPFAPEFGHHFGEDLYFCQLARRHGYQVMIDHDLSQFVQHQGYAQYGVHSFPKIVEVPA